MKPGYSNKPVFMSSIKNKIEKMIPSMETIPNKVFSATVLNAETVAQGVKKISIKVDKPFPFLAWQYVWVEIPKLKVPDLHGSRRAFSIFNTINDENIIEIVARISDSGYKQSLFALDKGENVTVHGPFGNSFIVDEKHQPENIVMLAGGIGIAAFLPMLWTIRNKSYKSKCFLVYLNKDKETTPFLEELDELKKNGTFFDYKNTYEYFSWEDVSNFASEARGDTEWWVAGPQGMVDHTYAELEKGGVSSADMVFENFYPTKKSNLTQAIVDAQAKDDNLFVQGIQNSTNHTIITDAEGIIRFANKASERITGYPLEEIIGNTPRLWGGMMSREFYSNFWSKKVSGEPFVGEVVNRRKNGKMYHAMAHIAPIFGEGKDIVGFIGTEEDITERVKLEERIIESQDFLNSIIANLPNMVFVKDANSLKFVLFNKAGEDLTGLSAKEVIGKSDRDFFPKEQADFFTKKDREVLTKKQFTDIAEEPIETKSRGKRILHTKKIPVLNTKGNPTYLLGISEDITEDKADKMRLKEKNDELERLNKAMVGRELKMIELKKEITALKGDPIPDKGKRALKNNKRAGT